MTGGVDPLRTARLDELRRRRGAELLAVIAERRPVDDPGLETGVLRSSRAAAAGNQVPTTLGEAADGNAPPGGRPALRRCAARELQWLVAAGHQLVLKATLRTGRAPRLQMGVGSPYLPSTLVVTYDTRYVLADPVGEVPAVRDVYVVHGALQTTALPTLRSLHDL